MPLVNLSDDDIFTLRAAVENLRSPDKAQERTIEAAWRIASKLEAITARTSAAGPALKDRLLGVALLSLIAGAIFGLVAAHIGTAMSLASTIGAFLAIALVWRVLFTKAGVR
jgi:hypothetical protein